MLHPQVDGVLVAHNRGNGGGGGADGGGGGDDPAKNDPEMIKKIIKKMESRKDPRALAEFWDVHQMLRTQVRPGGNPLTRIRVAMLPPVPRFLGGPNREWERPEPIMIPGIPGNAGPAPEPGAPPPCTAAATTAAAAATPPATTAAATTPATAAAITPPTEAADTGGAAGSDGSTGPPPAQPPAGRPWGRQDFEDDQTGVWTGR